MYSREDNTNTATLIYSREDKTNTTTLICIQEKTTPILKPKTKARSVGKLSHHVL